MNSRLQNLSEEVITDWPETKDPLVTTFNIKVIFIIINTNIIKVILTNMFTTLTKLLSIAIFDRNIYIAENIFEAHNLDCVIKLIINQHCQGSRL